MHLNSLATCVPHPGDLLQASSLANFVVAVFG